MRRSRAISEHPWGTPAPRPPARRTQRARAARAWSGPRRPRLAEFSYRFNRRFALREMFPRLTVVFRVSFHVRRRGPRPRLRGSHHSCPCRRRCCDTKSRGRLSVPSDVLCRESHRRAPSSRKSRGRSTSPSQLSGTTRRHFAGESALAGVAVDGGHLGDFRLDVGRAVRWYLGRRCLPGRRLGRNIRFR